MAKPNITVNISDRDKKLLLLLFSFLLVVMAYYFGYEKFEAETKSYEKEVTSLKAKERELLEKHNNIDQYKADTEGYKIVCGGVYSEYGTGFSQPQTIEFLNKIERITGAWIKSVSFSQPVSIYSFGQLSTSNPSSNGLAYTTNMEGVKNTVVLAYEADYSQWKKLVETINSYYTKNTIENITMSFSKNTGMVSGTMTVSLYSILNSNNANVEPEFDIETGSENIFFSDSIVGSMEQETGEYILANYDYYILLNSPTSAIDSCVMGKKGDGQEKISNNSEEVQDVKIVFSGTQGNYTVKYAIGDKTFPENNYKAGKSFEPGQSLDLLILSQPRVSKEDKAGINLTIENTSDMALNVKVLNDDKESRVSFDKTEGNVVLY